MTTIRTYQELIKLKTFDERYQYLKLDGQVGVETFGFDRYINQAFYSSKEWRRLRDEIIVRDNGCDLGVKDYDICSIIIIHHMNPIKLDDILYSTDYLLNPDYLISTSLKTHNGLHYGIARTIAPTFVERFPNDMCPWKIK